jgi:hypothetical protein
MQGRETKAEVSAWAGGGSEAGWWRPRDRKWKIQAQSRMHSYKHGRSSDKTTSVLQRKAAAQKSIICTVITAHPRAVVQISPTMTYEQSQSLPPSPHLFLFPLNKLFF